MNYGIHVDVHVVKKPHQTSKQNILFSCFRVDFPAYTQQSTMPSFLSIIGVNYSYLTLLAWDIYNDVVLRSLDVIVHLYNGNIYWTKHNRKAISVHPAVSLCDSLNNKPKQYLNCTRQYARKNVNAFERNATSTRN